MSPAPIGLRTGLTRYVLLLLLCVLCWVFVAQQWWVAAIVAAVAMYLYLGAWLFVVDWESHNIESWEEL